MKRDKHHRSVSCKVYQRPNSNFWVFNNKPKVYCKKCRYFQNGGVCLNPLFAIDTPFDRHTLERNAFIANINNDCKHFKPIVNPNYVFIRDLFIILYMLLSSFGWIVVMMLKNVSVWIIIIFVIVSIRYMIEIGNIVNGNDKYTEK